MNLDDIHSSQILEAIRTYCGIPIDQQGCRRHRLAIQDYTPIIGHASIDPTTQSSSFHFWEYLNGIRLKRQGGRHIGAIAELFTFSLFDEYSSVIPLHTSAILA